MGFLPLNNLVLCNCQHANSVIKIKRGNTLFDLKTTQPLLTVLFPEWTRILFNMRFISN